MLFSQVIGQSSIKSQIQRMLKEERIPHALLFAGPEGSGKLPMALALATRLLCEQPTAEGEPCHTCHQCAMTQKLAHPDLHFIFPNVKPEGTARTVVSDDFLPEWRKQVQESPYFTLQMWQRCMKAEKKQAQIMVGDANAIIEKLAIRSNQTGKQVVVIWMAELMRTETANKLLKILEEPPIQTYFILTADHPERLLPTILSRTQRIDFPPLTVSDIQQNLCTQYGLQEEDARFVANASAGNYIQALKQIGTDANEARFFDLFVLFMRLCYSRNILELHKWAEEISQWGREEQKAFLEYSQRLVRENFMYNFHLPELNYMTRKENDFSVRFARFINERNVIGIQEELGDAQRDIEQNVNARMVFFDLALKMIVLLIQ